VLYISPLHGLFDVTYPEFEDWITALAFMAITFGVLEIGKLVMSRRKK
jgi:hypothetical protein